MNKLAFIGMQIAFVFAMYHNKKFEKWKAVFDKFYEKVVRYE